jgi:hypothetical protein
MAAAEALPANKLPARHSIANTMIGTASRKDKIAEANSIAIYNKVFPFTRHHVLQHYHVLLHLPHSHDVILSA